MVNCIGNTDILLIVFITILYVQLTATIHIIYAYDGGHSYWIFKYSVEKFNYSIAKQYMGLAKCKSCEKRSFVAYSWAGS